MKKPVLLLFLLLSISIFAQSPMMQQDKPSAADVAKLTKLERAYKAAKAALALTPKSEKAKKDFAAIGAAYGHESMMTPVLGPKVKYAQALRIYREVLKVDPKQPVARDESALIIRIYKSLGRTPPQG